MGEENPLKKKKKKKGWGDGHDCHRGYRTPGGKFFLFYLLGEDESSEREIISIFILVFHIY
jgi:hypothetical protein